jgi:hypothetical protein
LLCGIESSANLGFKQPSEDVYPHQVTSKSLNERTAGFTSELADPNPFLPLNLSKPKQPISPIVAEKMATTG